MSIFENIVILGLVRRDYKDNMCFLDMIENELVDILKDIYEFYYFSEDVDSKTGLSFDYKLKNGITESVTLSAIALKVNFT